MRSSSLFRLPLGLLLSLSFFSQIRAVSFTSAPPSNLDLSQLGRVALAGNFDAISLYNFIGQDEDGLHTNGSQSLLGRYPNGGLATLKQADAAIQSMCSFVSSDGTFNGVIVAGNFTSLGGQQAQAVALFNPDTQEITPLPGLTGQVSAVYCDQEQSSVYFGGSFSGGQSSNAIAWVTTWTNMPFAGFNGPVASIAKLPNGKIIFGGSFTSIGNTNIQPREPDAQVVNLPSAQITYGPPSTQAGYVNGSNIICKTSAETGSGNNWLLADAAEGYWQAEFGFGFEPTKLRLYQSQVPNYGTKTWRFTAQPLNGIMNFTFVGPDGVNSSCTNECPLPDNNSTYQDFHFVNTVGMNAFRIDISDWYGAGAGLGGIELFQNDIYSFAIQSFNEPPCDGVSTGSSASSYGNWTINDNASGLSSSQYLEASFPDGTGPTTDLSVVFRPDIKQSGNYSVIVYTPGCIGDNSCDDRGVVSITGQMSSGAGPSTQPIQAQVYQTNNYDKYDEVYNGYVDMTSDGFTPAVTLTPTPNQGGPLTVVAQRVRFELKNSTGGGGLNGLYEFDPNVATVDTDFSNSVIDQAGTSLNDDASITSLVIPDGQDSIYVGGMFSSDSTSNIMAVNFNGGENTPLPSGGLNDAVQTMVNDGSTLYLGGNFTNTRSNDVSGLNNVAAFSTSDQTWQPMGAGVNGMVWNLVPMDVNVSTTETERGIVVSGWFDQVLAFNGKPAFSVQSLAVWVPARNDWLENLNEGAMSLDGRLTAYTDVPDSDPLFAGRVDSQSLDMSGVAELTTDGSPTLEPLGINIEPFTAADPTILRKRDTSELPVEGVVAGLFYTGNNKDLTIIGGHFTATASNGSQIQNLAFIDRAANNAVTGLAMDFDADEAVLALEYHENTLFVGGSMSSNLVFWDLAANKISASQPQSLVGGSGLVKAIAARPDSSSVFVGGSFSAAGSFDCPALCVYDTSSQRWQNPFNNIGTSSVVNAMTWASSDRLIIAGNMTIGGNYTTMATFDAKANVLTSVADAGNRDTIPGPITTFTATDESYESFFVSGVRTDNGMSFIAHFDGKSTWTTIEGLLTGSLVQSLQTLMLTQNHDNTDLLPADASLLIAGHLILPTFGNVSAALFDGSVWTPFVLTTMTDGTPGSIWKAFVQNPQNLLRSSENSYLATGFVVLIALALALALTFLIVVGGIVAERIRRRREGYVRAPTTPTPMPAYEKQTKGKVGDIPPEAIFGGIGGGNGNNSASRL